MRKLILAIITVCLTALYSNAQVWIFSRTQLQQLAQNIDTAHYKFPLIRSADSIMLDTATVIHQTRYLNAFNEPAIFCDGSTTQTVRFTWLRSNNQPVMIRMVLQGGHVILYWKIGEGSGFAEPGKLVTNKQKTLSEHEWRNFRKLAMKINTCKVDIDNDAPVGRKSEWLLEGKLGNMYVLTKENSPSRGSDLYKSCDYLIGLTDITITEGEKY